ncbi:MAG: FxSxx-COOH system tetratricopeptide repeat protein, partial [Streptosporangiaceae bacterium]
MIWGNVPQRNKNFTGRDDILGVLRQGLSRKVTAVLPHALQGMGGVGKTAVAVEYAHRYKYEYELIWWVPADQPALVQSSLASLADRLGLPPATATGIADAAAATLDALRRGEPYKHWLLIFDNADQPEDLNDIIPQGPGDVLITSRNHRWQSVVETVQVDVFNREESVQFLDRRVPGGLSDEDANALADKLGDLPLALEQAGALQAETGMTVDEYLRLLEKQVAAVMSEGKSPDYPLPMTAAWKLSVQTLEKNQPQAVRLLRCCAFFGAEPIPRDLLPRGAQALTDKALSELLADPIKLARAIRELGRFALIRIDGRTIAIHRLIQALLRDELSAEERDAYRDQAHLILSTGAPRNAEDNRLWPRYSELVAHAQSTGLEQSANPEVRRFALDLVRYLYNSGDQESARSFAEQLIEVWEDGTEPTDRQMLTARQHLGNVERALGHYGPAFAVDSETLTTARDALGEDDPITLVQVSSYTADLRARGDFQQALQLDVESLDRHRRVLGPDHPWTLRVSHNLANDFGLNSQYIRSRDQHQETYRRRSESIENIPAPELLSSWNGLARALRLCGDYAEARDVGQDAYDFGLTELGPDHPRTLETAIDLSVALRRTGVTYDDA